METYAITNCLRIAVVEQLDFAHNSFSVWLVAFNSITGAVSLVVRIFVVTIRPKIGFRCSAIHRKWRAHTNWNKKVFSNAYNLSISLPKRRGLVLCIMFSSNLAWYFLKNDFFLELHFNITNWQMHGGYLETDETEELPEARLVVRIRALIRVYDLLSRRWGEAYDWPVGGA